MTSRVRARLRARAQGDDGFTIVEAVVSMVLLVVLSAAVLGAILSSLRLADQIRSRTVATSLATREIAEARASLDSGDFSSTTLLAGTTVDNPTPLDGGTLGEDLVVGGTSFTVSRTVSLTAGADGQSLCASGTTALTGTDNLQVEIEVSVTWSGRGSFSPVRVVERVGLPDGVSVGADALVVVQVIDPTNGGAGVEGASVTLQSNRWYYTVEAGKTDSDGCVLATVRSDWAKASTSYTAVVSKTGYTSQSWTATAATSIGKLGYGSGTLINRVQVTYAPSVMLRVHVTNEDGTLAATDAQADGLDLTLLCSSSGTAASEPGWTTTLTGAMLEIAAVWPCEYSAYLGADLPQTMRQVQVSGGDGVVDVWVRPGYGIVEGPTGQVVPSPEPSPEESTAPADPSPVPSPSTSSDADEPPDPQPSPSASTEVG